MIVAIHQPNYLPYLGVFHKMRRADVFILYDTAQFSKNEFHNRNRIKTARGTQWLTVPVRASGRRPIRDVEIDSSRPWADRHRKALQANYARTPHFEEVFAIVSGTLDRPWTRLAELNVRLLELVREALDLSASLVPASTLDVDPELPSTEKVACMVAAVGGTTYLSGASGKDYLDQRAFDPLRLEYDDFRHPTYPQPFGPFVPNLSVVDALFNVGGTGTQALLKAA